jgi:hypothetical protein
MDQNQITTNQSNQLAKIEDQVFFGLFDIEPDDILPAPVKLIQGSSDLTKYASVDGNRAVPGQFYFYSKKLLLDKFDCYFITIFKQPDRFSKNNDMSYVAVGVMDDLDLVFQMDFKKAAIPSIKHVISLSFFNQMPIYGIKVNVSSDQRKGQKGSYYVPKITFVKVESDLDKLEKLSALSKKYAAAISYFKKELVEGRKFHTLEDGELAYDKEKENIEEVNIDEIDKELSKKMDKEDKESSFEQSDIPF